MPPQSDAGWTRLCEGILRSKFGRAPSTATVDALQILKTEERSRHQASRRLTAKLALAASFAALVLWAFSWYRNGPADDASLQPEMKESQDRPVNQSDRASIDLADRRPAIASDPKELRNEKIASRTVRCEVWLNIPGN